MSQIRARIILFVCVVLFVIGAGFVLGRRDDAERICYQAQQAHRLIYSFDRCVSAEFLNPEDDDN